MVGSGKERKKLVLLRQQTTYNHQQSHHGAAARTSTTDLPQPSLNETLKPANFTSGKKGAKQGQPLRPLRDIYSNDFSLERRNLKQVFSSMKHSDLNASYIPD
jgi:hypothetical protein